MLKQGQLYPQLYSFGQLAGASSTTLIDFTCRFSWSVTDFRCAPIESVRETRLSDRVYGCRCAYGTRTFAPVVVKREDGFGEPAFDPNGHLPSYPGRGPRTRAADVSPSGQVPKNEGGSCEHRAESARRAWGSDRGTVDCAGRRQYQCPFCAISCANTGQLRGHLRVHTGEKPYVCDFSCCGRAFARNEELTRHRRIHSGIRPHSCDLCQRKFGRKDHLNKHVKTHLKTFEKKTHHCNVLGCKQKYTRSDALARHLWHAHGIRAQSVKVKFAPYFYPTLK